MGVNGQLLKSWRNHTMGEGGFLEAMQPSP